VTRWAGKALLTADAALLIADLLHVEANATRAARFASGRTRDRNAAARHAERSARAATPSTLCLRRDALSEFRRAAPVRAAWRAGIGVATLLLFLLAFLPLVLLALGIAAGHGKTAQQRGNGASQNRAAGFGGSAEQVVEMVAIHRGGDS
jgi:hypothetical protein